MATRNVLEGVPRIGFWHDAREQEDDSSGPEDITWPAVLRAYTTYLGEPYDYAYTGLRSSSTGSRGGTATTRRPIPCRAMLPRHSPTALTVSDSDRKVLCDKAFRENEDNIRAATIDSIDRGVPVISHGVVGPPEPSIITGYTEDGDVLIGWSFFQNGATGIEFESCGYFRKRNRFDDTYDLLLQGDKWDHLDANNVLTDTLTWGLEVSRTPNTWKDRHNGHAAYEAWASQVEADPLETADAEDDPFHAHSDAVGTVAECRWYGSRFLAEAAGKQLKMVADLLAAASFWADEHDLMWKVWGCVGGHGEGQRGEKPSRTRSFARRWPN